MGDDAYAPDYPERSYIVMDPDLPPEEGKLVYVRLHFSGKSPKCSPCIGTRWPLLQGEMDKKAIRDRIDLIAHERGLPESEVTTAKTCTDTALLAFAGRHDLSVEGDGQARRLRC
jgi:hypothetical protein